MRRQNEDQEQAGNEMDREPEMARFIAVVKSSAADNEDDQAGGESAARGAIDAHFPTATNVVEPEKAEKHTDRGVHDAMSCSAGVGP